MSALQTLTAAIRSRLEAATPGPWFVAEQPFDDRSTAVYGDNKAQVACDPHGARFVVDCDVTMEWTEGEPDQSVFDRANANLIANAPTDLDRLLRIVEVYEAALKLYQQGWSTVGTHELDAGGRRVFKWRNPSLDFIGPAFADEALAQADAIARGEGA